MGVGGNRRGMQGAVGAGLGALVAFFKMNLLSLKHYLNDDISFAKYDENTISDLK